LALEPFPSSNSNKFRHGSLAVAGILSGALNKEPLTATHPISYWLYLFVLILPLVVPFPDQARKRKKKNKKKIPKIARSA
jgi:UDP-N-acetylmuramyl pentapeptide phosphotransferase/UDP-N-acetylglucosamine-1-phosphate transferase